MKSDHGLELECAITVLTSRAFFSFHALYAYIPIYGMC